MVTLLLTLCLATPGPSAKWLRLLQPRPVEQRVGVPIQRPTKARLIELSKERIENVPGDLGELAEIHGQATAVRRLVLPGLALDAIHEAFLGGRNRLTSLAAQQYAWSAALHGEGPLDHHARVRMETSAGPRVVRVHLTGDRDEPEISVEVEASEQALAEDHVGALGARYAGSGSHPIERLAWDPSMASLENFLVTDGPRPNRAAVGRVREDGTFEVDRLLSRSAEHDAPFEDRLAVSGRVRDDGMVELWSLDRKYVLGGLPLSNYRAVAHGVALFEAPRAAVPPRASRDPEALVRSLSGPMRSNRWSSRNRLFQWGGEWVAVEEIHRFFHTDFLNGATDGQLMAEQRYFTPARALFGWGEIASGRSRSSVPGFAFDNRHRASLLTIAPLARALELMRDGGPKAPSKADRQLAVDWAKRFLTGAPVRADFVTPDTVPYLARMALAAGIPFDEVNVQHAGAVIPLTHHPSFPREARDLAAEEQFLDERLTALGRLVAEPEAATKTAAESEVRALLFDGPRFHFGDVVAQVIFNRELWEAHLPEGAAATPHAFEDATLGEAFARELFQELRHPGAAAVLCGLLTRVPEDALRRALSGAGSQEAEVWARIGAGLQRFPAKLVPYVLADVLVDPEHRHLDADVLDIRVRALQTLLDLQEGRAGGEALALLGRKVEAALGARGHAILARALVDDAPFFTREGSLTRVALADFFQERMRGIAETEHQPGSFFAPELAREPRR